VETVDFLGTEVTMPCQSSKDLVTQAANQLKDSLLHPQSAEPFYQVGDDQMITFKRLAAIFEDALPSHKSNMTPPQVEINDSGTPPRVKITALPMRVKNQQHLRGWCSPL
jgi:hypothetical protein